VALFAFANRGRMLDSSLPQAAAAEAHRGQAADGGSGEAVETRHPTAGGMARTTEQPGSAHSFQSAELFSKVSGYLKTQLVDIGSVVKRGELLAELDVPELVQELERDKAHLRQAQSEVAQAQSNVGAVMAEQKAAEAYVVQTQANAKRSESERQFREKQYKRIRDLNDLDSVEERLVDEKLDQLQAAQSAELAAQSAVVTAQQQVAAAAARVSRAEADLEVAKSKVQVAEATLKKTGVLLSYTRITSPYDGVVTRRSFHPGAFIRSAEQGDGVPLLCVDRTDLMRVVVQVPDRDVPYVQAGDPATIFFDALPKSTLSGRVARIAASEDQETRTMRVEIDVPNPRGIIRDGMYGQVEIVLEKPSPGVTVPSACLVGDSRAQSGKLFVVRDGKAYLVNVKIGKDTGQFVEVESGLTPDDLVVVKPPATLADGMSVQASESVAAH
jgi:RND family efflux transporter MFP subunit